MVTTDDTLSVIYNRLTLEKLRYLRNTSTQFCFSHASLIPLIMFESFLLNEIFCNNILNRTTSNFPDCNYCTIKRIYIATNNGLKLCNKMTRCNNHVICSMWIGTSPSLLNQYIILKYWQITVLLSLQLSPTAYSGAI